MRYEDASQTGSGQRCQCARRCRSSGGQRFRSGHPAISSPAAAPSPERPAPTAAATDHRHRGRRRKRQSVRRRQARGRRRVRHSDASMPRAITPTRATRARPRASPTPSPTRSPTRRARLTPPSWSSTSAICRSFRRRAPRPFPAPMASSCCRPESSCPTFASSAATCVITLPDGSTWSSPTARSSCLSWCSTGSRCRRPTLRRC